MPGMIDLSSVIAGMNAAASASMQGAQVDDNIRFNKTPPMQLKKPKKIEGQGKAAWDSQVESATPKDKPLTQHIMEQMTPPDLQAQDSLLSLLDNNEQQYALNTYDLFAKGNS